MKKILHLTSSSQIGGAEKNVLDILVFPAERGFVHYAGSVSNSGRGAFLDELKRRGIQHLDLHDAYWSFGGFFSCVYELYKYIKRNDINLVHTYGLTASLVARIACRLAGIKNIQAIVEARTKDWRPTSSILLDRWTAFMVDEWIANSKNACDVAFSLGLSVPTRTAVVYGGFDVESAKLSEETIISSGQLNVIVVANIMPYKGHRFLVDAINMMTNRRVMAHFVGRDDTNGELEKYIRGTGLGDKIKVLGFISEEDKLRLLSKADVFILPSETESFPISIIEAMAFGKPVIAANVGGIPELVENGVTGFLVPPRQPLALKKAIELCFAINGNVNHKMLYMMGMAGRKTVESKFTIEKMVVGFENCYSEILAE